MNHWGCLKFFIFYFFIVFSKGKKNLCSSCPGSNYFSNSNLIPVELYQWGWYGKLTIVLPCTGTVYVSIQWGITSFPDFSSPHFNVATTLQGGPKVAPHRHCYFNCRKFLNEHRYSCRYVWAWHIEHCRCYFSTLISS